MVIDGVRDVLDRLVAEIGEAGVQLVAHLLVHGADAAGLGSRLVPRVDHVDGLADQAPPFGLDEFLDDLTSGHAANDKA